jgi:hypothetical protein
MNTTILLDASALASGTHPANGSVHYCAPHPDELARHRVISADGYEVVVTTVLALHGAFLTSAYPVQHGYLVMICQPYFEAQAASEKAAAEQHEQLVRAVAGAGAGIVRARRRLAARQRSERLEASIPERHNDLPMHSPR